MTARKIRPTLGTPVADDMSLRDVAAALGWRAADLVRCKKLAALPEAVFEDRLKRAIADMRGRRVNVAAAILRDDDAPVPIAKRVDRALALWRRMTPEEQDQFVCVIAARDEAGG